MDLTICPSQRYHITAIFKIYLKIMGFEFLISVYEIILSVVPLLALYYGYKYKYISAEFNNSKDEFNVIILFILLLEFFRIVFIDYLYLKSYSKVNIRAILHTSLAVISVKLVERLRDKVILVSRFLVGFIISYAALNLLPLNPLNNNFINITIGLVFSQITLLAPLHVFLIYIFQGFLPFYYDSLLSITNFEFFNFDICLSIISLYIGTFITPNVLVEYNTLT
jgi:hypothetical protein